MALFGKKKRDKDTILFQKKEERMIGPNLSFSAKESYNLLRTNIMLSLPNNGKCKVIGVTSADAGEGKSTTAINLAYSLSQNDKKVLLIEGDMRKPTIATRLGLRQKPGLSNMLAGLSDPAACFRNSNISQSMTVLTSGDTPPNPSELLSSDEMVKMIEACKDSVDYIILDLPPLNVVPDALVVSNIVDGMIFVVRSDFARKAAVTEALRQLEFAKVKILGFVLTNTNISSKSYSRYGGKYGKYYKYGSHYYSTPNAEED
ncbi:MAG: CpsD/CapB family tyrosine-protein kinase [Oscillospiraceae bacterium]|nr:CpsD/CapB family tyrosine-protein kinase [Oscillospiraceae bacterium]